MKWFWRILKFLGVVIGLAILLLWITGNDHILRGIPKTYLRGLSKPDIDDIDLHPQRLVANGTPEAWPESHALGNLPLPEAHRDFLEEYDSEAFLVWVGDSLIHETYWGESQEDTHFNSFSMAKSFTSIAIGCAIDEGKIGSVQDPIGKYVEGYQEGLDQKVTLESLLQMASGIDFGESTSSPFGFMAKAYFGTNLEEITLKHHASIEPGTLHIYEGGNTVLLGLAIREATGKSVAEYFSEKVWSQIGAEHEAYWNVDREDGIEKTFSAFYATARDFGRIGKLFADSGRWKGNQIVSSDYVKAALTPAGMLDDEGKQTDYYGYQWWLNTYEGEPFFFCQGMRGQYIIVLPESDIMIVRIGHHRAESNGELLPPMVRRLIDAGVDIQKNYAQGH